MNSKSFIFSKIDNQAAGHYSIHFVIQAGHLDIFDIASFVFAGEVKKLDFYSEINMALDINCAFEYAC